MTAGLPGKDAVVVGRLALLLALVTLVASTLVGCAGGGRADLSTPDPLNTRAMLQELGGDWSGYLEYIDFQSGEPVRLPARAYMDPADREPVLTRSLAFTDPGYVVESFDVVVLEGERMTEITTVDGRPEVTSHRVVFREYRKPRDWTLVLQRMGEDDGQAVEIRLTQTLKGKVFTSTRDVRPEGQNAFAFRNRIRVQRVD